MVWEQSLSSEHAWYNNLTLSAVKSAPNVVQLSEWTLLMDAFISSTETSRPKNFGLTWESPNLTMEVPTAMLITLSYY